MGGILERHPRLRVAFLEGNCGWVPFLMWRNLMENLQKDILPSVTLAYDPAGMLDGYAWIKHLMSAEGADVIFAHDADYE
jgi:hypothetical protein